MKRKALALIISFVLLLGTALPGTLAVSHDSTGTGGTESSQKLPCCGGVGSHLSTCTSYTTPLSATSETENDNGGSDKTEYSQKCPNPGCNVIGPHVCRYAGGGSVHKECNCNVGREEHLLCCPLHVKDEAGTLCPECKQNAGHLENCQTGKQASEKPSCTCNVAKQQHAASCPLWTAGAPSFCAECGLSAGHLTDCSHYEQLLLLRTNAKNVNLNELSHGDLFQLLMATETMEEYDELLNALTDEAIEAFIAGLSEADLAALRAHVSGMMVMASTVSFTRAGPFRDPVQVGFFRKIFNAVKGVAAINRDEPEPVSTDGLKTSKVLITGEDGKQTLRLESYVTGSTTVTSTSKPIPVDIVLVLDQSGSMAYDFNGNQTSTNSNRRQAAMKVAVNSFITQVKVKAESDNVDHRMAIVTFGSGANTLQNWTTVNESGAAVLISKINGLPAEPSGATNIGAGMNLANSLTTGSSYSYTGPNTERQKVVIAFTDGVPTKQTEFDKDVANAALAAAKNMKDKQVTVYSVGIFGGAAPNQLHGEKWDYLAFPDIPCTGQPGSYWGASGVASWFSGDVENIDIPAGNRFLNYLSSKAPTATAIGITRGTYNPGNHLGNIGNGKGFKIDANAAVNMEGRYYLTAANAAELNNIFSSISEQIQTGQAAVSLGTSTVVQDVISDYFQLPDGVNAQNIVVKTAKYKSDGTWEGDVTTNLTPTLSEDRRTIRVSGFDFSLNYCDTQNGREDGNNSQSGNFYGRKLILEIPIEPRDGFLGGNGVPTNGAASGVYQNGETLLESFLSPRLNVAIPAVTVEPADKNVYLLATPTEAELKKGVTVKANGNIVIDLDPNASNYGLQEWQNDFVVISGGGTGTSLSELEADTTYTLECKITPKTTGTAVESTGTGNGKIRVFKPEITFKDKNVLKGEVVTQETLRGQQVGVTQWTHPQVTEANPTILGTAPTILLNGTLPQGSLDANSKVQVTTDIDVDMSAKVVERDITAHVTYHWSNAGCTCAAETIASHSGSAENKPEFRLHVETGTLVITKSGEGRRGEGFVFNVTSDSGIAMRVSCAAGGSVTITNLPKGTYTVTEEIRAGGAWRYNFTVFWTDENKKINDINTIDADHPTIWVTVKNKQINPYLLDGYAFAENNSVQ